MAFLEFFGMFFAASGFGLISFGRLKHGFILGLFSCCLLMPFFYLNNMLFMLTLQCYFAIMNTVGIGKQIELGIKK